MAVQSRSRSAVVAPERVVLAGQGLDVTAAKVVVVVAFTELLRARILDGYPSTGLDAAL